MPAIKEPYTVFPAGDATVAIELNSVKCTIPFASLEVAFQVRHAVVDYQGTTHKIVSEYQLGKRLARRLAAELLASKDSRVITGARLIAEPFVAISSEVYQRILKALMSNQPSLAKIVRSENFLTAFQSYTSDRHSNAKLT